MRSRSHNSGLPASSSPLGPSVFSVSLFFFVFALLARAFPGSETTICALGGLTCSAGFLVAFELLVRHAHRSPTSGLRPSPADRNIPRVLTKLLGAAGSWGLVLALYRILPFYRDDFYTPFFQALRISALPLFLLTILYFWLIDPRQTDPRDEYWQTGRLLLGKFRDVHWPRVKDHLLGWLIKSFFTPIMFGILVRNLNTLPRLWPAPLSFEGLYAYLLVLIYTVDVIVGSFAYVLTLRVLDTQIRSTEPTVLGFVVCLICYYPVSNIFGISLFSCDDGLTWQHWFALYPVFYYFYGTTIIFLSAVYSLSTVALGLRASNLTYRGLITGGPYHFCKHPAYLSKVVSWWLLLLPFYSVDPAPWSAAKNTSALAAISLIYYLRAKTEENHLSNYPEYVCYARGINRMGLFRIVAKYLPGLAYSQEKTRKWGSVVWFKRAGRN